MEADIPLPLRGLGSTGDEVWLGQCPVRCGREGAIAYREDGAQLMGWIWLDGAASRDMETAARVAYTALLRFLDRGSYPHLLRVWNYFDGVTVGEGEAERYRRFCLGRHEVLAAPGFESRLPAATVIGSDEPGYLLVFLASRQPGVQVENPRQISAFRYPGQYGRRSPSFSRATRHGDRLYVSGTAAILGHATQHPNEVATQLPVMIGNVRALLEQSKAPEGRRWAPESLRLYLPREQDAALCRSAVRAAFGADAPLHALRGDICRHDLCVEMEGVWRLASVGA